MLSQAYAVAVLTLMTIEIEVGFATYITIRCRRYSMQRNLEDHSGQATEHMEE